MTADSLLIRFVILLTALLSVVGLTDSQAQSPSLSEKPKATSSVTDVPPASEQVADQLGQPIGRLPGDYRDQLVRFELKKNPDFTELIISYSDPVRVRVHGKIAGAPVKEMTAVVYSYTPRSKDGFLYLMIVEAAALFDGGAYMRSVNLDSPEVEWIDGQPLVHSDMPEGKKYELEHRFSRAERLHNPRTGPTERRQIRRDTWLRYGPAIAEMKVPVERVTKLRDLLEAREETPLDVQYTSLQKGIDPFSATMGKTVAEAKVTAEHDLESYFGPARVAQLEYLSAAISQEGFIKRDEGLDLADARIPLSAEQLLAVGKIYEDIRNYRRNSSFQQESQYHDPATGLSGLDQAILERTAKVLTSRQQQVVRRFMMDRAMFAHSPRPPPGRDSSWLLHEAVYGPVFHRQIRRWVLRDYYAAVAEMNLPKETADKLMDLLVERNLAPREATYAAEEKGMDRQSTRAASKTATDEADGKIRVLLGDGLYQQLEGLKLFTRVKDNVVRGEAVELELEGCPLTSDQLHAVEEAFWKIHTVENPNYKAMEAKPADPASGLTAADLAFLERTATILSPRQQEVVRTYRMDFASVIRRIEENQPKH